MALYRHAVDAKRVMAHYEIFRPAAPLEEKTLPEGAVLIEIFEGIPDATSWSFRLPQAVESYTEPAFALVDVRNKYSDRAILVDRTNPFLLHATGLVELPKGSVRLLLRARGAARLFVDGRLVVETPFPHGRSDGHEAVHETASDLAPPTSGRFRPATRSGPCRSRATDIATGCGWKCRSAARSGVPELGETLVAIARGDDDFRILGPTVDVPLTDAGWEPFAEGRRTYLARLNTEVRRKAGPAEAQYWQRRHELARREIGELPALTVPDDGRQGMRLQHDRSLRRGETAGGRRRAAGIVRRLDLPAPRDLDLIGTIPTPRTDRAFFADPTGKRRPLLIDRLLDEPGWADHWVGYWQDVLAENPNILKPTLNNTGPFRWWIHESFARQQADRPLRHRTGHDGRQHVLRRAGRLRAGHAERRSRWPPRRTSSARRSSASK